VHVSGVGVLTDGSPSTVDHQVTNYSLVNYPAVFSLSLLYASGISSTEKVRATTNAQVEWTGGGQNLKCIGLL